VVGSNAIPPYKNLALIVEDEFGIRIDDSELNADTFDTLDALVKLIESRK